MSDFCFSTRGFYASSLPVGPLDGHRLRRGDLWETRLRAAGSACEAVCHSGTIFAGVSHGSRRKIILHSAVGGEGAGGLAAAGVICAQSLNPGGGLVSIVRTLARSSSAPTAPTRTCSMPTRPSRLTATLAAPPASPRCSSKATLARSNFFGRRRPGPRLAERPACPRQHHRGPRVEGWEADCLPPRFPGAEAGESAGERRSENGDDGKTVRRLAWIAERLNMGTRGHLAWLLQRRGVWPTRGTHGPRSPGNMTI